MLRKILFTSVCCVLINFAYAHAITINLNNFYADPTVTVAADGLSATIAEDSIFDIVFLSNDPLLSDPNEIPSPLPAMQVLSFYYEFVEPVENNDEFGAFLIDPATGGSAGLLFEFFTDTPSSGNVSFDLSSLAGTTDLGFQFQLSRFSGDLDTNSYVNISNFTVQSSTTPIPEPNSILLLGFGLICLAKIRNKKYIDNF